jgi:NAD(P)-dependent dehydrogenase (short-subunit alcohol dehydrogenase family)
LHTDADTGTANGKVVLISGAGRGIGRACAIRCAQQGADVVLFDLDQDLPEVPYPLACRAQLDETAALCGKEGAAVLVQSGDVRDGNQVAAAVEAAIARFGQIDALVNNAGIAAPSGRAVHEFSEAEWAVMLDINLSGAWRMIKAVVPHMLAQRQGSIVNVASTAGLVGYRDFAGYVAAKHGLVGLTKAAALDLAPSRIRVNAVCPGSVRDDPALDGRMLSEIARSLRIPVAEHENTFVQAQPTNQLVDAWSVAAAVVWLVSDDASQVTGATMAVDGGFTAR